MSVYVTFRCGGCDAKAEGTSFISRENMEIMVNFYQRRPWNVDEVAPDGWVASDPYTGCCYCPTCWAEIEGEEPMTGGKVNGEGEG